MGTEAKGIQNFEANLKNCILYFETVHFSKSLRFCYLNICKSYCKTFFYAIINIIVYEIYVFVFSVLKRAGNVKSND